jgi:hypothetical protein
VTTNNDEQRPQTGHPPTVNGEEDGEEEDGEEEDAGEGDG